MLFLVCIIGAFVLLPLGLAIEFKWSRYEVEDGSFYAALRMILQIVLGGVWGLSAGGFSGEMVKMVLRKDAPSSYYEEKAAIVLLAVAIIAMMVYWAAVGFTVRLLREQRIYTEREARRREQEAADGACRWLMTKIDEENNRGNCDDSGIITIPDPNEGSFTYGETPRAPTFMDVDSFPVRREGE